LSRIIKASRITGEYKIDEKNVNLNKGIESSQENSNTDLGNKVEREEIKQYIQQAELRAAAIIEEAEKKAQELLDKSLVEAERNREEGYNQGYQEGFAAGQEEGREKGLGELKNLTTFFDDIIRQTREELENDIDNLKRDIIELIIKVAERVLNTELEVNPEVINSIVSDMLDDMGDIQEINIHINPELTRYIVEEDFKTEYVRKCLNFIADNGLKPGDCIIETKLGGRDGTIETKLNLIKKELLKGVGYYEGT
jgi:flagellar assembly protein FliH